MIGIDTNVIVRYLVQDDAVQSAIATEHVESLTPTEPGFLSLVTVVEVWWVLRRAYGYEAERCASVVEGLMDSAELRVESDRAIRSAVEASRRGVDFADALIAQSGREAGCHGTITFDRRAARSGAMTLVA